METRARLGPYRLDELTGEGSVARVYKAWHTKLQRYEALKLLRDSMAHEATIVARFLSEAHTAARLHHPHIATIYSVDDGDGSQPYFTMEMVEGRDLGEHLRRHGPLTLDEATPLLHQIASAVDYAHRLGVIHRDIKPANILLGDSPAGGYHVKLVDFGIARVQAEEAASRLTQTGGIVGTPKYISPEQANEQPVDYRADIYSLGVVAYEMMCGRTPFEGDEPATTMALLMAHVHTAPPPPRELAPALSQTTNDAILRSLAKSPDDRFSTCGEFVRVLTAPRAGDIPAAPTTTDAASPAATRVMDTSSPGARPMATATSPAATQFPAMPIAGPAANGARPTQVFLRPIGAAAVALVAFAAVFTLLRLSIHPAPAPVATAPKPSPKTAAPKPKNIIASKPAPPTPPHIKPIMTAAKSPTISTIPHLTAKAPAKSPVVHVATQVPAAPKTVLIPTIAVKPKPVAAAPIKPTPPPAKPAPKPVAHLVKATPKPVTHLIKAAVKPPIHLAKPATAPAHAPKRVRRSVMAHAAYRDVLGRNGLLRRRSRPIKPRIAARSRPRRALADAWASSSRQEMALAHSFHAQGDAVQAAALAQNAEDSRRHALNASGGRKRKRR